MWMLLGFRFFSQVRETILLDTTTSSITILKIKENLLLRRRQSMWPYVKECFVFIFLFVVCWVLGEGVFIQHSGVMLYCADREKRNREMLCQRFWREVFLLLIHRYFLFCFVGFIYLFFSKYTPPIYICYCIFFFFFFCKDFSLFRFFCLC